MKKLTYTLTTLILLSFGSCTKESKETTVDKPNVSGMDTLHSGNLTLVVDGLYGARIVAFTTDGNNILIDKAINSGAFGSTFWTSPQSDWSWPPVAEIDTLPYSKMGDVYVSAINEKLKLKVSKKIIANDDSSFSILYKVYNVSDTIKKVAPWEISRVASGGLTFFASELKDKYTGQLPFGQLAIKSKSKFAYHVYDSAKVADNLKSFAFADEGWMAFAKNGLVFIKIFENIEAKDAAINESEIELYANPNKKYIEIENQGKLVSLSAGDSLQYAVKWYLKPLNIQDTLEAFKTVQNFVKSKNNK